MTDMDDALRALALDAGRAVTAIYDGPGFETRMKSDDSPVTEADLAADRIIAAGLARAFPDIPVVTEERAESREQTGLARFFLVDPLDGTKEFIGRGGDFTVNIALVEAGRPVRGVVHAPAAGRLFRTKGDGAVREEVGPDGAPVPGSETPIAARRPDNRNLTVVASKSHRDKATDDLIARYDAAEFAAVGSSLKFCLIAEGRADFYPRLGRTMEWDTAAGHAVLAAAGGSVLRFDDRAALAYGKPGYENPFFLAFADGVEIR